MNSVLEAFSIAKSLWVLICEGDAPDEKMTLHSTVGDFPPGEYTLGICTHCFSEKSAFAVRISTDKDCTAIRQVTFK